jgi:glutathione S-transferase
MRRLTHILMSPSCRLARLVIGEKRLALDLVAPPDPFVHLPVFTDLNGTSVTGLWAIIDHIETEYGDQPLLPEDAAERAEALRLVDWAMTHLHENVTKRIVFEKAAQVQTGAAWRRPPNMETVRLGRDVLRETLRELCPLAETRGYLASRGVTLADLALGAHLSALDYYGEVPWADFPVMAEWYTRMKSRPAFRSLLSDRVPGQPPAMQYAELDF